MITKDNLETLLSTLDFEQNKNIFSKTFENLDASLQVDFDKQQLFYPENKGLVVNQRQTCNFSDNENFVVFECVHRLLEKGYKPEHIELEPKWKVGHGASGGRADILVKDNDGKALLIIECKTEGKEFKDAWRKAQNGVSQLLTYAQQQRSTDFLCLYASDFRGGSAVYENYIITLKDNEKLLDEKKDFKSLTYKDAEAVEDLYRVWKETYALDYATKGIFELDIQPYHIGKLKYTTTDLSTVRSDKEIQSKYHEFATILRQHNVSGRENAFDKLVNLFLCKIVDESRNPQDLQFYWKGIAYDSPFDLQDRLQKLYKDGMNEFLGEDVTYIDEKTIRNAFHFVREKPDATRQKILGYFRELKFFTNNDFAFIDVHNEKLFHQNFDVLLKIVKMLQDLRLQSDEQNQFLGDMFEGFLDQGVKQSEGQFFTPSPITKFIMMSLPLERIIERSEKPPSAIDYACGAGHFLNELAMQIKPLIEKHGRGDAKEFYRQIYGVEKEYRLSKVAKVSAFMYGQDEINIIYGDALGELDKTKHRAAANVKNDGFDILTANPPYSVKGFLETLTENERAQFELIKTVEEKSFPNNNSIETFFVERAKQLLKSGGVAGIIAPSSILNKGAQKTGARKANNYVATRETLLKYFDIVAIVELGSQTFGKTGTNTVILFLRRKDDNPAPAEHYQNRVNEWFAGNGNQTVFDDEQFIKNYCDHVEINLADYKTLLAGKPGEELLNTDVFKEYRKDFDDSGEVKDLKRKRYFKEMPAERQKAELSKRFLDYIREIEKDKLYYFTLADTNPQNVVIVKAPADNRAQKQFLGYEWSSAKGNEGIKYFAQADAPQPDKSDQTDEEREDEETERIIENLNNLSRINTALYDPQTPRNPEKINTYIERNFNGEAFTVPDALAPFLSTARLVDMLDFTRRDFNKTFSLTPQSKNTIETKWDLVSLGEIAEIKNGATPDTNNPAYWENGDICWATLVDTKTKYLFDTQRKITEAGLKNSSAVLLPMNTVIFSSRATIGEVCINKVLVTTNQGYKNFVCNDALVNYEYLYYILVHLRKNLENLVPPGTKYKEINTETIRNYKIPLPPKEVQTQIVAGCEAVDVEVSQAKDGLTDAIKQIEKTILKSNFPREKLGNVSVKVTDSVDPQTQNGEVYYVGLENIETQTGRIVGNPLTTYSNIKSVKTVFKAGDVLYGKLRPNLNKVYLAERDGVCSTDILAFRFENKDLAKFYYYYLLSKQFNDEVLKTVAGQQLPRTSWTNMEVIKVPVLPLPEQEKLIAEIEILETKIAAAQKTIDAAAERKQAVMKRFL